MTKVHFVQETDNIVLYYDTASPVNCTLSPLPKVTVTPTNCYGPLSQSSWLCDTSILKKPPHCRLDFLREVELEEDPFIGFLGELAVLNVAFEKNIFIHYSFDGWKTKAVVQGEYLSSIPSLKIDKFKFQISWCPRQAASSTLELAIEYKVAGQGYWDNFGGANYQFKVNKRVEQVLVTGNSKKTVTESFEVFTSRPVPIPTTNRRPFRCRTTNNEASHKLAWSLDSAHNGYGMPLSVNTEINPSSWHPRGNSTRRSKGGCLRI